MTENPRRARGWNTAWMIARPFTIFLCACLLLVGVLTSAWDFVFEHYFMPADANDQTMFSITIKNGSSVSSIAKQLQEEGFVRNKGVFQYLSEFVGQGHKLKAGTYELSKSMNLTQIIDILSAGDGGTAVMKFRVIEGLTVEAIAQNLVEQKVFASADRFLEICKTGAGLTDKYPFIADVVQLNSSGRHYALEGYLYPDTYEIYVGSSEETVIGKMLDRMAVIYGLAYVTRAKELNMTMDQVLALASMIEKEGKTDTFSQVSAVFHNRLAQGATLGSDVTIHYASGIKKLVLSGTELEIESAYNTYKYKGLPVGSICNPGSLAIDAALYPDEQMVEDGYLYFTLTDPETGELKFSKTLKEHEEIAAQYRDLWRAYDEKNKPAQ